ncbi:MAG: DnaJ domain-containing protein [Bacteroidia bacterium]|nr:DnaJ domain-containing protein [Bacteroidia bacterium]
MINYYKILGLENYASVAVVKSAYKKLIKQYHPDVSSDPDAEEMTRYLNLAKDFLGTQNSKDNYDRQLKLAYLIEINRLKSQSSQSNPKKNAYWKSLSVDERKSRLEEARKIKIKEKYEKSLSVFPLPYRLIGIAVFLIWGLQVMFSNYFLNFSANAYIWAVVGYFIFGGTLAVSASEAYTYLTTKSLHQPIKFNFERWIAFSFVAIFILGIISVSTLNYARKSYFLNNDFEYTTAKIDFERSSLDRLIISYEVNQKEYIKRVDVSFNEAVKLSKDRIVLKFARVNPLICEVVLKSDSVEFNNNSRFLE